MGDFPLDGERPFVAKFLQRSKVGLHTDVAFAERDFCTPFFAADIFRCPRGVFAVDAANQMSDLLQSLDRIAGPVQDHVGGVEIDEQVVAIDIANELQQVIGRFLSGFEVQVLAVVFDIVKKTAGHLDQVPVAVGVSSGHESDVHANDVAPDELCKVRDRMKLGSTGVTQSLRDNADCLGSSLNTFVCFSCEAAEQN